MTDRIAMTWPMFRHGECRFDGQLVALTRAEADMVATLLIRRGTLMSLGELIEALWDPDEEPDTASNVVHVMLCRLRRKLPGLIETWWGRGFHIPLPPASEWRQAA